MSRFPFNRTTVGNTVVRFFNERRDAIGVANELTNLFHQQHNAVHTQYGWLVENAVTKQLNDIDGKLPEGVDVGAIRR